jgi:hypothetical protein
MYLLFKNLAAGVLSHTATAPASSGSILYTQLPEIRCHIGVDNAWMEGNYRGILTLGCSVGCELEIRELGDGVA